jgi:hypothetical protein
MSRGDFSDLHKGQATDERARGRSGKTARRGKYKGNSEGQLNASCPFAFEREAARRRESPIWIAARQRNAGQIPFFAGAEQRGTGAVERPWMSGRNGGQMRRSSLNQEKQKKTSGKAATMPDKTASVEDQEAVGAGGGGGDKAPRKRAKKALRRALKVKFKKDSSQLADALTKKVKEGDVRCAGMVLTLMEHDHKEDKDKKKKCSGPKLIDLLESELEREAEEAADVEAGVGVAASEEVNELAT